MGQTQHGKKTRHGGDNNLLHEGGGTYGFRATALFAGMGGWKGARRSGCGMRGGRGTKRDTVMVTKVTKIWQNEPGSKRRRRKNRAWRGQSAWNAENFKRDFEIEACKTDHDDQCYFGW